MSDSVQEEQRGGLNELEPFRRFLRLDPAFSEVLEALRPVIVPRIPLVADRFYNIMESLPEAMAIFKGGRTQLERQRAALCAWLEEVFVRPHDDDYIDRRRKVGIVHLNAGVDEHLMIASMNWLRTELTAVVEETELPAGLSRTAALRVLHEALDFDLGVILNSYWTDLHARMTRIDRLALIGQFTAAINHELRNPLGVITTSAYLMRQHLKESRGDIQIEKHIDKIDRSLERANSIVNGLLRLMRVQVPARHSVDVEEFIRDAVADLRIPENLRVEFRAGVLRARGSFDRDQLRQVIENLVRNAIEALPEGGQVQIAFECDPVATTLSVRDNGPGIPKELRQRIFEPLFSTKPVGTGLGLTLARAIVEAHGGALTLVPGLGGVGVGFEIRIPHFLVPNVQHHG